MPLSQNQYVEVKQNNEQIQNENGLDKKENTVVRKTDEDFFTSIETYFPICYSRKGTPIFLINHEWKHACSCLVFINIFLIGTLILFIVQSNKIPEKRLTQADKKGMILVNIGVLILINLSFFLTLALNPGVRNLSTITENQYEKDGKIYCLFCLGYRTQCMKHCRWCKICVQDLDHHCGFFGKCIAGCQRFAFYLCLTMIFGSFLTVILSLTLIMGF